MTAQVAVKTAEPTDAAQPPVSKGEVAVLARPRLPYHPVIEERFGIDRAAWKALVEAVFPMAKTTDSVCLALSYCRARRLDPFKRVVHIVPIWDNDRREYVETVWPGIAEHRTTAFRTKQYAGSDACQFGPMIEQTFEGETKRGKLKVALKFPEWAQLTVYRLIDGQRVPVPGPRVYWLETYSRLGRAEVPNDMWQKRPVGQLEKCAEAAALRRAFPEELGDEITNEEVGVLAAERAAAAARDVTPARPTRAAVTEATAEEVAEAEEAARQLDQTAAATVNGTVATEEGDTDHDPETGEVTEATDLLPSRPADAAGWPDWSKAVKERIASSDAATLAAIQAELANATESAPVVPDAYAGVIATAVKERKKALQKEHK